MSRARELAKFGGLGQQVVAGVSSHVGVSTFAANVFMYEDLSVIGNLNVTGDLSYDETTATNSKITGVSTTTDLVVTQNADVSGIVSATTFVGAVTGNVTGNVTGDLTGDVTGNLTGNISSNTVVSGIATFSNHVIISGNLQVDGTTTTVNSTTLTIDDKNIELAATASPSDATADGGGITLKGSTDHTFNWVNSTDAWTSSEHMNLATGKVYRIAGTEVLSASQVHGASIGGTGSGDIVTIDGTQTLSNKTLSATTISGHQTPSANNTYDLGSSSNRFRNVYANDIDMSNEGSANDVDGTWGSYLIQEGEEHLYIINRRSGKKFRFMLEEV